MLDNGLLDAALEELGDEELMDDYANHAFYCGLHVTGLCTNPQGQCTAMQEARSGS